MAKILRVAPYADDQLNLPVVDVDSAVKFYEIVMGFSVESRSDIDCKKIFLERDGFRIGIAENGGDPSQEGCFFEVDDVEAMSEELKSNGLGKAKTEFRIDQHGDISYKVFFVIAPDGLCYCLGQQQS